MDGRRERVCLLSPTFIWISWLSSDSGYSSTNLSELDTRTELKMSIHLRELLSTYGSSYKYGSRIRDSASTPIESSESGRNHMADTMALLLQRASHDTVVFLPLIMNTCSYFLQRNAAIRRGRVRGQIINLHTLGIGNGITVRTLGSSLGDVLLTIRIRTHFRNTMASYNMLSRIHITL